MKYASSSQKFIWWSEIIMSAYYYENTTDDMVIPRNGMKDKRSKDALITICYAIVIILGSLQWSPLSFPLQAWLLKTSLHSHSNFVHGKYRVILKTVLFGIFDIILVSKEEKDFTVKSKYKVLSLSKFSWYLAIVKIIKIRHLKGHISQKNHDLKIIFMQK